MEGEVFIVTIVAIACITGLIKSWINRHKNEKGVDKESFNRLAQAFMQHKKEMKERVENLEAIITEEEQPDNKSSYSQIEARNDSSNSLTNDLQEKNRVRS